MEIHRIKIKANRGLTGSGGKTVWSMLIGGDSYWVDLPEGFLITTAQDGSLVITCPYGVFPPHQIIVGEDKPYLKIGYKVFPLSNLTPA